MNVLCLDQKTVLVEQAEDPLAALLDSLGCDVIGCPFDAVIQFGGALTAAQQTCDAREGSSRTFRADDGS